MLKMILSAVLATVGVAQTLTLAASGPVYPGATLSVTATLAGSSGQNISGIGFTLPEGVTDFSAGAASSTAAKSVYLGGGNVLLIGMSAPVPTTPQVVNNTAFADGIVGSFSYVVPAMSATISLGLTSVVAVSTTGSVVNVTSPALALPVAYTATCLAAISSNIQAFLKLPSAAVLQAISTELEAAVATGTCL